MENATLKLEDIVSLIETRKIKELKYIFEEENIVDLADIVTQLDVKDALFIFKLISNDITGEIFAYLDHKSQKELIEAFTNKDLKDVIDNLYTDDIVDVLNELPSNLVSKVLKQTDKETRAVVNQILDYKDDTAGSIMTTEYVELDVTDTCGSAIKKIKEQGPDAETINYCYVIDHQRRLQGIVSLKDILFSGANIRIESLMEENVIALKTYDDQEEAAMLFKRYDFTVMPVVNDQFRLLGIITIDDIIDIIEEENTEDMHLMAGMTKLDTEYLETSVFTLAKSRIVWLMVLMLSATLTGSVIDHYETALASTSILMGFIPMLMGTGGNAGSQASTLVIRGLATGDIETKDYFKVFGKELSVALISGSILACVNFLRIIFFVDDATIQVALVVSLSLICTITLAKVFGGLLPILVKKVKLDPAVMAAPLLSTVVDAVSLVIYFTLATNILNLTI